MSDNNNNNNYSNIDIESRITKIEASIAALTRIEKKLDDLSQLTTKIASIEERHHFQSSALERAFAAIEKNATQIETLRESIISRERYSTSTFSEIKDQHNKQLSDHVEMFENAQNEIKSKMTDLETEVVSKVSWAKGAWFAASVLWVIIQIGMIWGLKTSIDTISETKNAVVELRIESNNLSQKYKDLEKKFK